MKRPTLIFYFSIKPSSFHQKRVFGHLGRGGGRASVTDGRTELMIIIVIIIVTRPRPAFGRLGLGGLSRGYSSYRLTSHASLRACGAQLGGKKKQFSDKLTENQLLLLI